MECYVRYFVTVLTIIIYKYRLHLLINTRNVSKTRLNLISIIKLVENYYRRCVFACIYSDCNDFFEIYFSHGSVATQLRCGGIFDQHIIANCPQSVPVKEFLKLVNIWQRYRQKFSGTFFLGHDVVVVVCSSSTS